MVCIVQMHVILQQNLPNYNHSNFDKLIYKNIKVIKKFFTNYIHEYDSLLNAFNPADLYGIYVPDQGMDYTILDI